MKTEELYTALRDRINTVGFGYGPTKEGYELTILKRFFTPEDAEHWMKMPLDVFFNAADYAEVGCCSEEEAGGLLDDMALRGLIYRRLRDGEPNTYRVVPVAHGVLEFNVDDLAESFAENKADWAADYGKHANMVWGKQWFADRPFFRAVPINSSVVTGGEVLPYDDAEALIRSHKLFAVSKCLCRVNTAGTGGYDDPRKETCLAFDDMARFYLDVGIGRELTMQDAIDLIHESIDLGYCIHVANSKEGEVMCSCDAKVCGLLQMTKAFGGEGTKYVSHYKVDLDKDKCVGCGACVKRCPTECCSIGEDGKSAIELERCVGCGQCTRVCKSGARTLIKRPDSEIVPMNDTLFDTYSEIEELRRKRGDIK